MALSPEVFKVGQRYLAFISTSARPINGASFIKIRRSRVKKCNFQSAISQQLLACQAGYFTCTSFSDGPINGVNFSQIEQGVMCNF